MGKNSYISNINALDMQTEEVLDKLREYKAEKADAYGIEALGLFGSYARGEQKPGSDIDVCLKLKKASYFDRMSIKDELEKFFNCKVDVVSLGATMRPMFKKNLERDAVFV